MATTVNAVYTTLATFENVLIFLPKQERDRYLKPISAHQIDLPDGKSISVAEHLRKGFLVDGQLVTGNFFITDKKYQGQTVLTNISVIQKTDLYRDGRKSLILDITLSTGTHAQYKIQIGVPDNGANNKFSVPGTKKFVQFLNF